MFKVIAIGSVLAAGVLAAIFGRLLAGEPAKGLPRDGRFPHVERLTACAMWASLLMLALSGFFGGALTGEVLGGRILLAHVGFGGLFAVSLAVLSVFRAAAYSVAECDGSGRYSTVQKLCFWALALSGVGMIFSILSMMYPILGSHGQMMALKLHKCFALAALLVTIVYAGTRRQRV